VALLKAAPGREAGGYERLFGDAKLGRLLSRVQSAVIRAGAELEQVIIELANTIDDADAFLDADILQEGVFAVPKKVLKKSKRLNYAGVEPDFVVFKREGKTQHCYLIELKDGDTFDTKKAAGEKESMQRFLTAIAPHIQFTMSIHFCCFHRLAKQEIVQGFKRKITINEAMTGPEFCELLGAPAVRRPLGLALRPLRSLHARTRQRPRGVQQPRHRFRQLHRGRRHHDAAGQASIWRHGLPGRVRALLDPERVKAGMQRAKAQGKHTGCPALPSAKRRQIEELHRADPKRSLRSIAKEVKAAPETVRNRGGDRRPRAHTGVPPRPRRAQDGSTAGPFGP
jgi:hypothetical protein